MQCMVCGKDNPPEARFCANCGSSLVTTIEQPALTVLPSAKPATLEVALEYVGSWRRFAAAIIDLLVVSFISFVVPFGILLLWLYYWLFTGLKGQTLGKMAVGIKVVDAAGSVPGLGPAALREVPGKIVSSIAIFLGFLWIIWDGRKQGWHDKIASTYVVRVESRR